MSPGKNPRRGASIVTVARLAIRIRAVRAIFGFTALILIFNQGVTHFDIFTSEMLYRKDFTQDYLAGRALNDGSDPYARLRDLQQRYLPDAEENIFPHPTPHTPFVLSIASILARSSIQTAALLWFSLEILALFWSLKLLVKLYFLRFDLLLGAICIVVFLARPVQLSLILGQQSLFVLLTSTLFLAYFQRGREFIAGLFFGSGLALKFFGMPILIYLALRRRWRALAGAFSAFLLLTALSALYIGVPTVRRYYSEIAPQAANWYQTDEHNQSLWTLSQRFFGGLRPGIQIETATVAPIVDAPHLVRPFAPVIPLLTLALVLYGALRARSDVDALPALFILSALFSPLGWLHGLTVIVIGIFSVLSSLGRDQYPERETRCFVALVFLFFMGDMFRKWWAGASHFDHLSALLTYVPMCTGLLWCLLALKVCPKMPDNRLSARSDAA